MRKAHPDKLCDLISDTVLDRCLEKDPLSRVALEVLATSGHVVVAGEVTTDARIDYGKAVKDCLASCGYRIEDHVVYIFVHTQSSDIAGCVDEAVGTGDGGIPTLGAGDQGTVYGYATDETDALMPAPVHLAHLLARAIDEACLPGVLPDGKCQVGIQYEDGRPIRIDSVVVSVQTTADKDCGELEEELRTYVFPLVFTDIPLDGETIVLVNPSGRFVEGGPSADTGLTGRKVVVDAYGGAVPHGGGAFSGKDATKVDRSAAYMARCVARTVVKAGIAHRCLVSLSYAIGKAEPVAVSVDTYGTGEEDDDLLADAITKVFDLRPEAIIDMLSLRSPLYAGTASYGHFGHPGFPWEDLDLSAQLVEALSWTRN